MKSKIKILICNTFSFILTILFFLLLLCVGLTFGMFNNKTLVSKLMESNYYGEAYEEINQNAEKLVKTAGLPVSVLEDVITLDRVYIGGSNFINNELSGDEDQIKTQKLKAKLSENIHNYLDEHRIIWKEHLDIDQLISEVEAEYVKGIQLHFIDYYLEYKSHFLKLLLFVLPSLLILISILCYFLIRMNQYKHRGLRYINYALIAASGMTILLAGYLLLTKQYEAFEVSPDYYLNFLTTYLKWDVMIFIYLGEIGLVLALVMISLTGYLKNHINNS